MKQILIIYLALQPVAIVIASVITFWPALILARSHPKVAQHVAAMIRDDLYQQMIYFSVLDENGNMLELKK